MAVTVERKQIPLDRRVCFIGHTRIDIRPSRGALMVPLVGLLLSVLSFIALAVLMNDLPLGLLALLLIIALIIGPLSVMAVIHSLFGAYIIVDAKKQSVRWQQGALGLGLGTQELVPFWKIDHIAVEELALGQVEVKGLPPPLELRAWDILLVKTTGKRLPIGQVVVADEAELVEEGLGRARQVAAAIAALVAKPVRMLVTSADAGGQSPERVKRAAR